MPHHSNSRNAKQKTPETNNRAFTVITRKHDKKGNKESIKTIDKQ